jgi:hypothetical protein
MEEGSSLSGADASFLLYLEKQREEIIEERKNRHQVAIHEHVTRFSHELRSLAVVSMVVYAMTTWLLCLSGNYVLAAVDSFLSLFCWFGILGTMHSIRMPFIYIYYVVNCLGLVAGCMTITALFLVLSAFHLFQETWVDTVVYITGSQTLGRVFLLEGIIILVFIAFLALLLPSVIVACVNVTVLPVVIISTLRSRRKAVNAAIVRRLTVTRVEISREEEENGDRDKTMSENHDESSAPRRIAVNSWSGDIGEYDFGADQALTLVASLQKEKEKDNDVDNDVDDAMSKISTTVVPMKEDSSSSFFLSPERSVMLGENVKELPTAVFSPSPLIPELDALSMSHARVAALHRQKDDDLGEGENYNVSEGRGQKVWGFILGYWKRFWNCILYGLPRISSYIEYGISFSYVSNWMCALSEMWAFAGSMFFLVFWLVFVTVGKDLVGNGVRNFFSFLVIISWWANSVFLSFRRMRSYDMRLLETFTMFHWDFGNIIEIIVLIWEIYQFLAIIFYHLPVHSAASGAPSGFDAVLGDPSEWRSPRDSLLHFYYFFWGIPFALFPSLFGIYNNYFQLAEFVFGAALAVILSGAYIAYRHFDRIGPLPYSFSSLYSKLAPTTLSLLIRPLTCFIHLGGLGCADPGRGILGYIGVVLIWSCMSLWVMAIAEKDTVRIKGRIALTQPSKIFFSETLLLLYTTKLFALGRDTIFLSSIMTTVMVSCCTCYLFVAQPCSCRVVNYARCCVFVGLTMISISVMLEGPFPYATVLLWVPMTILCALLLLVISLSLFPFVFGYYTRKFMPHPPAALATYQLLMRMEEEESEGAGAPPVSLEDENNAGVHLPPTDESKEELAKDCVALSEAERTLVEDYLLVQEKVDAANEDVSMLSFIVFASGFILGPWMWLGGISLATLRDPFARRFGWSSLISLHIYTMYGIAVLLLSYVYAYAENTLGEDSSSPY